MPDILTSTLLTLTGVLALLAALAVALIWVKGQAGSRIPSVRGRVLLAIAGVALTGAGIWLDYQRSLHDSLPQALTGRVDKAVLDIEGLDVRFKRLDERLA